MGIELQEDSADQELLERLTQELRSELLDAPVDDVQVPSSAGVPDGTRGVTLAAAGALLVVLKGSAELIGQVVEIVMAWWKRKPHGRTIKITVGANALELSNLTEEQQERLIDQFVKAVSTGT